MKSLYFFHISLSLALAFLSSMRFAQTPSTKSNIKTNINTLRYGSLITPSITSIVTQNTPKIVNLFLNQNLIVFFFIIVVICFISYCKDTTKISILQAFRQLFCKIIIIFLQSRGSIPNHISFWAIRFTF